MPRVGVPHDDGLSALPVYVHIGRANADDGTLSCVFHAPSPCQNCTFFEVCGIFPVGHPAESSAANNSILACSCFFKPCCAGHSGNNIVKIVSDLGKILSVLSDPVAF